MPNLVDKASNRLESIKTAHHFKPKARTPRMEDYLEVIFELIQQKGYATTGDISTHLNVRAPSVTKMVQRLRDTDYLVYERYKGLSLTEKGMDVARGIRQRHGILTEFLIMVGVDEDAAHRDAEGIEHYLEPKTLERLERFVKIIKSNPEILKKVRSSR